MKKPFAFLSTAAIATALVVSSASAQCATQPSSGGNSASNCAGNSVLQGCTIGAQSNTACMDLLSQILGSNCGTNQNCNTDGSCGSDESCSDGSCDAGSWLSQIPNLTLPDTIGQWIPGSTNNTGTTQTPDNSTDEGNTTVEENTTGSSESSTMSAYELAVVELVNEARAQYGLSALTANEKLSDVARMKSQDMLDNNYFSHTSPTYGTPFEMMKAFGITYNSAGENIAYGYATPEAVVNGWMNSSGHRANILSESYTQIGVGYVANGNYWTQMFIG